MFRKGVNRLKRFVSNLDSFVGKQSNHSFVLILISFESDSRLKRVIYVLIIDIVINSTKIMGNKISCCKANTPQTHRKKHESNNYIESDLKNDRIGPNLQHISEREPDDNEADPSSHPTAGPLFMQRSRSDIRCKTYFKPYFKDLFKKNYFLFVLM